MILYYSTEIKDIFCGPLGFFSEGSASSRKGLGLRVLYWKMGFAYPWRMVDQQSNNNKTMENQQSPSRANTHSLQADLLTGWKPKLKIIGPMPLNFDNPLIDKSIMALIHQQSAFYEIIYLGLRPISTFKMHEFLAKTYRFKYSYLLNNDFAHLKPFYKKFYSLFEPQIKRPFHGTNPNISKKEIIFESLFESGNLDCVVRLKSLEYDIILRVDSNTSGHVLWYYFRVHNPQDARKTLKLNIVNLKKSKTAYERGMRPFVKREGKEWQQQGENVAIVEEKLRYHKQNLAILIEENHNQLNQQLFRKLTFNLDIAAGETIELAYSVPYTYSQLLEDIRCFKKKSELIQGTHVEVDLSYESLSGLEIPVMRIYHGQSGNGKYCAFIIGRQHPGESNGSYVLKGTLDELLSGQELSLKLLRHCDFVVIPMLNPDGVVAGNFRTSLYGKDLNRLFKSKETTLLPEIEMARTVFTHYSGLYKRKLLLFLDYHGHSARKNAFVLGPGIFDAQLLSDIRILPKIMANYTEIFRYPSCSFRLDESKKTTARALFGKLAGLSYTIQASNWAYYSKQTGMVNQFTTKQWHQLGAGILKGIEEFVLKKVETRKKFDSKVRDEEKRKLKMLKSRQEMKMKAATEREKSNQISLVTTNSKSKELRSHTETKLADLQFQEQEFVEQNQEKDPLEVKQANQSDEMSENGMDTDSEVEDMQKQKFKKYIKAASEMLVEFQEMYYGENYRKRFSKYKNNLQSKSNRKLLQKDTKKKNQLAVQACLRPNQTKKVDMNLKAEDYAKQFKKKLYLEDEIIRDSFSKVQSDIKSLNDYRKRNLAEPTRKMKIRIGGEVKEQLGFSEELQKFQKIQRIQIQRSLEKKKKPEPRLQPMLIKASPVQIVNSINLNIALPMIREAKNGEKSISNTSNVHTIRNHDKMGELLSAEEKLNKSTVMNVLRLSRAEIDTNHYF